MIKRSDVDARDSKEEKKDYLRFWKSESQGFSLEY